MKRVLKIYVYLNIYLDQSHSSHLPSTYDFLSLFSFQKMEKAVCVKKDLLKFTEMMYGKEAFAQREQFGLPADKYEAAMMKWAVKDAYMTPNQKFMNQFFFGIE